MKINYLKLLIILRPANMPKRKPNEYLGSEKSENHMFGKDVKKQKRRIKLYQMYESAINANISHEGNSYIKAFMELFINIMEKVSTESPNNKDGEHPEDDIENIEEIYYIFKEKISYIDGLDGFYHYYIWPGMQSEDHPLGSEGFIKRPKINETLIENRIGYIFYLCLKFSLQLLILLNDNSFEIVRPLKLYRGESEQYTFIFDKLKKCTRIPIDSHSLFKNDIKQSFTSTALLDDLYSAGGFGYATHGLGLKIYVRPGMKILPTFYFNGEKKILLNDIEYDEIILKPGLFLEKKVERNATREEFVKAKNKICPDHKKLEDLYVHEYHYRDDSFDGSIIPLLGSKLFEELFLNTEDLMGFYQHVIKTEESYKPRENEVLLKCLIQDCSELIKKLRNSYKIKI